MQVPVGQWYPDKIQPSPEGKKVADTGDVEGIVVDPASSVRNPVNSAAQSGGFRPPSERVGGRGATDAVVG
ncbi:MAG: hypothetical protein ACYDB2_10585, partial [Acidimicrobiales bacterium]